jgi:hypothetical protein
MQDVPRSSLAFWVAPEAENARKDADEDDYPDVRYTPYRRDRQIHNDEELSDSDYEDGITYAMSRLRQKDTPTKSPRNYRNHGKDGTYGRVALRSDTRRPGILEQMMGVEQHANTLSPTKCLTTDTNVGFVADSPTRPSKARPRDPADDPRCECCKVGKTKCDKARPFCSTCVRRNRQDRCLYRRLDGTIGPDPGAEAAIALGRLVIDI